MGTTEFAATVMAGLIEVGHRLLAVYTQPPRPAVRVHRLQPSFFFFQAEDGIRAATVTGVQTCALPISARAPGRCPWCRPARRPPRAADRKSTRLNSSHGSISYAVFCLKKKKKTKN